MSLYLMEPSDLVSSDHPVNQLIESLVRALSASEFEERFGIGSSTVLRSRFEKIEDGQQASENG